MISNLVYLVTGVAFIAIVAIKQRKLSQKYNQLAESGDQTVYGVAFEFESFYAMGVSSIAEGTDTLDLIELSHHGRLKYTYVIICSFLKKKD